jgi:hypothetical protein
VPHNRPKFAAAVEQEFLEAHNMRCMSCGGEMILMKAIEDRSMPVSGFERHAYMCSVCHETEQRTVFNKPAKEPDAEIVPVIAPSAIAPRSTIQNQRRAQHFLARVIGKMRGKWRHKFRAKPAAQRKP